ncbi:SWI/SNF-related matrix-associated actin-dependent regulator of chromatin subfamily A containing DEAD/H box 1B-like [Anneissia japonica]|uniref:SWI/SNF-related matrix-associated actin-dependent regulator of chromatin subfamily A containing DEAD/H box 1B-like n=1 Tax=Anneissia japonica TaxID=1529436 RepID=UPI001425B2A5|nr:SWI/SNF-related matrix-associated actin-dependent regulator of chromatin subfamily A containing DEAD/H box 1B-like [Anneissia japonica]
MSSIDLSKFRYQNNKNKLSDSTVGLPSPTDDKKLEESASVSSYDGRSALEHLTPKKSKTGFFLTDITCIPETPEQSVEEGSPSPVFDKGKAIPCRRRSESTITTNQMNSLSDQESDNSDQSSANSKDESDNEYLENEVSETFPPVQRQLNKKGRILSSDEDCRILSSDVDSTKQSDDEVEQQTIKEDDGGQLRTCAKRKMRLLSESAEESDDGKVNKQDEEPEEEQDKETEDELGNDTEDDVDVTEKIDEQDLLAQMVDVFPHRSKKALRASLVKNNWCVCDAVATMFENRSSDDTDGSLPEPFEKKTSRSNSNSSRWIRKADFRSVAKPNRSDGDHVTNGKTKKIKKRRRIEVSDSSENEEIDNPSKKNRINKKKTRTIQSDSEEEVCLLPKERRSHSKKRAVARPTTNIKWKKNLNGHLESSGDESVEEEGDVSSDEELETFSEEFKVKVVDFYNSASVEEMTSIEGSSMKKAELVASIRPFNSFEELMIAMSSTRSLGTHLVENAEDLFTQRAMLVSLMTECSKIAENLQALLADQLPRKDSVDFDEKTKCMVRQPKLLREDLKLKEYQVMGLNWLLLMDQQNVNGILADEMGLGKTIQTIAFLAHLVDSGKVGPHVIVVPSSTLDNWARELHTWTPSLVVLLYFGMASERAMLRRELLGGRRTCNIIVTTYNVCISSGEDRALFRKLPIQYAVFDEAHFLKNMTTQRYVNLTKINAANRLLLTGTPLQNNLLELISLLSFSMPNLFMCKTNHLQRIFCLKKQKQGKENEIGTFEKDRIAHAKQIMQPFVLRRIKADVLAQLPKKIEKIQMCPLEPEQERLNNELKATLSKSLQNKKDPKLFTNIKGAMMQLRKMANHPLLHRVMYTDEKLKEMSQVMLEDEGHKEANPALIFEDMSVMYDYELHRLCHHYPVLKSFRLPIETLTASGKFTVLDQLLPEMKAKKDRVLIFSQFVMLLEILEIYLQHRGHSYLRLDGQTPVTDRLELIDKYNKNPDIFIFLLSTKAGGLGINLTSANTVILHDIDYNPYNDKQAEDRCHRVGQTKNVNVIRLISKNTIEEGMLKRAQYKLQLERDMISCQDDDEEENKASDASILQEALHL